MSNPYNSPDKSVDIRIVTPISQAVVEGQPATFLCHSEFEVKWYRNNVLLKKNNQFVIIGRMLFWPRAKLKDQGYYTCQTTSSDGLIEDAGFLGVYSEFCLVS